MQKALWWCQRALIMMRPWSPLAKGTFLLHLSVFRCTDTPHIVGNHAAKKSLALPPGDIGSSIICNLWQPWECSRVTLPLQALLLFCKNPWNEVCYFCGPCQNYAIELWIEFDQMLSWPMKWIRFFFFFSSCSWGEKNGKTIIHHTPGDTLMCISLAKKPISRINDSTKP